ncbi:hypothetical protein GGR58DRAFT_473532 [Xylaria digitata]|nr:hypothetical protein GGR58DRAFT_473532 [Xylaria digitata]
MDRPQSNKIRYASQYFGSALGSISGGPLVCNFSQNEPLPESRPADHEDGINPIIEIVTTADAVNGSAIGTSMCELNSRGAYMRIHSKSLSQVVRDVVKSYPGQNLAGANLVFHEPYACLMHHMPELEHLESSDRDPTELEHVQVLLEFLRPRYQQYYVPAKERSLADQPTVRFDDLWVAMKPNSLAYTYWDGHKIGCVIGKYIRLPPKPSHDLPERWSIDYWFLQVHWPSDQIGCTTHTAIVNHFDGEQLITSLPIYPVEFHDVSNEGNTMQRFTNRGRKVCEILWGQSMYMEYDGECMDYAKQQYTGPIIVSGSYDIEKLYPKHNWNFNWVPPSEVMKKDPDVPLSSIELMVNPKRDHQDILTADHLFVLSPCLSAFRLSRNDWVPLTVENILPLTDHHDIPSPHIDQQKLRLVQALVDSQNCNYASSPSLFRNQNKGATILLHGPPGVGKTYMIEFMSLKSRRPLLRLSREALSIIPELLIADLTRWLSLGKKWNAIIVIDHCDGLFERNAIDGAFLRAFAYALGLVEGTLFLTSNTVTHIKESLRSLISVMVSLPDLDRQKRDLIWSDLERRLSSEERIQLHRNATKFLHSADALTVALNGHEINRCFKIAMALATAEAETRGDSPLIVEVDHFKEAMNIVYEPRQDMGNVRSQESEMRHIIDIPSATVDTSREVLSRRSSFEFTNEFKLPDEGIEPSLNISQQPITVDSDSDLCIPDFKWVEWDAFRAAGEKQLFRKTKYHAIDVLKGEPRIKLSIDNQKRRKRRNLTQKGISSGSATTKITSKEKKPIEATLPDRIRINSPAIIRKFAEICGEAITEPFLLFRPFRCLLYYEQEFRDAMNEQADILQEWPIRGPQPTTDEEHIDHETKRKILSAEREQLQCLISFIAKEIKEKQDRFKNHHCRTVPFADIPLLFNPGDAVVSKDQKQAFRVTRVSCTRHRVKDRNEIGLSFWKDESKVEFEDDPVFVHCIYVDFDGKQMGPVSRLFSIRRFDDEKEITSLPILPIQYAKEDGLQERLVERGKVFLKLASIRHMHYTGLALETRDEIDSQVVIDFDEAINREPTWKPPIQSVLEESLDTMPKKSYDTDELEDQRYFLSIMRQASKVKSCVEECCASETTHYDEYIENRRREDYIILQMNGEASTKPSVAIIPRELSDIVENNTLTDDEYLIMSYRVLGFVLRSRKWHALDMTHLFEVATLGAGEGFDELVLPPGHGDMVKSMIRQHLRDRKLSSINGDKTDVVRGKGRGLIMLLHGVPGVGKTSTAECVADLFRRPLFQITSGDLGTTARDVEDSLEENFSLASRWNSILLIDEADVFLAERTKEDFARNSLVAVFLRMMEYYSGVLFLTTNRVGVFDEAFTSRIHISLYYPPLDQKSTVKIFEKNWDRINTRYKKAGKFVDIKMSEITEFAIEYFQDNKEGRWNGRQIRNAFQSALALAELDALGSDDFSNEPEHNRPVVLGRKNFETVADAYKGFTNYLKQVYGADFARRARENLWRFDAFGSPKMPNSLNTRLKIVEPSMPPPGQWVGQGYPGHDTRNPQPYYQPQHHYPERYGHEGQGPRYPPTSGQHQNRDTRERWDSRPGAEGFDQ